MKTFSSGLLRIGTCVLATAALASPVAAAPVAGQGNWQTTLQARDLDGNLSNGAEAYYDTQLNVTWLADGFQAGTSGYSAGLHYPAGAPLTWGQAVEWASNLNLYGITDWRLPQAFDSGAPGCANLISGGECGYNVNPGSSEMAHLYFTTLGNISYINAGGTVAPGYGLTNTGPFVNVREGAYWSGTDFNSTLAWNFNTNFGTQGLQSKTVQASAAWAVLDGDRGTPITSPVPEPESAAMFGLGLLALVMRRKRLAGIVERH